jgi:hypothetical protein
MFSRCSSVVAIALFAVAGGFGVSNSGAQEADSTRLTNPCRRLAEDYMVWNVTKDKITERMAIVDHHTWTPPLASPAVAPDPKNRVGYSPEIEAGRLDVDDVIKPIYEEASKALGKEFKYPSK